MNASGVFRLMVIAAAVAIAVGCGSVRRGTPVQSEFTPSDPEVARGEQVFMRFCNGCHPGGRAGLGLAINDKPLPAFLMRFQVRNGLGVMPSFSEELIPDDDLDALARYLVELRHHR